MTKMYQNSQNIPRVPKLPIFKIAPNFTQMVKCANTKLPRNMFDSFIHCHVNASWICKKPVIFISELKWNSFVDCRLLAPRFELSWPTTLRDYWMASAYLMIDLFWSARWIATIFGQFFWTLSGHSRIFSVHKVNVIWLIFGPIIIGLSESGPHDSYTI